MPVSEQRLAEIRELSNHERVDRMDVSAFTEADWARFDAELDAETLAFCRNTTDPEELHAFAQTWNWDAGHGVLETILNNPACEAATALHIYWHAAPEWHRQFADADSMPGGDPEDVLGFLSRIEARYVAGAFPRGVLGFDPADPYGGGQGGSFIGVYDELRDRFVRALPQAMYQPVEPAR
ncbi:MAG: DUF4274 domain-containing protein [Alphaproteobacteria bacterium]|nr:DUF4274 domain-containing protein [Alphaproteobacteria bacterium]